MAILRIAARWSSLVYLLLAFPSFRCSFLFCTIKTNRNRENYTFGRRRSFGRVVSSSDISRILLPSCGSNWTFFFKHHRSQDRLSYCAAFSNLGVGVSTITANSKESATRQTQQQQTANQALQSKQHSNRSPLPLPTASADLVSDNERALWFGGP